MSDFSELIHLHRDARLGFGPHFVGSRLYTKKHSGYKLQTGHGGNVGLASPCQGKGLDLPGWGSHVGLILGRCSFAGRLFWERENSRFGIPVDTDSVLELLKGESKSIFGVTVTKKLGD